MESGKAAAIAGAAGAAADLPYLLFHPQQQPLLSGSLSVLGAAGTCVLFGLCYRYAIRQDLNNAQLKVSPLLGLVHLQHPACGPPLHSCSGTCRQGSWRLLAWPGGSHRRMPCSHRQQVLEAARLLLRWWDLLRCLLVSHSWSLWWLPLHSKLHSEDSG